MKVRIELDKNDLLDLYDWACQYDSDDADPIGRRLYEILADKLDAILLRSFYSEYKNTSLSNAERQEALKEYLDRRGIPANFRYPYQGDQKNEI